MAIQLQKKVTALTLNAVTHLYAANAKQFHFLVS